MQKIQRPQEEYPAFHHGACCVANARVIVILSSYHIFVYIWILIKLERVVDLYNLGSKNDAWRE